MTKLSELKAGDRFTVTATVLGLSPSGRYIDWKADGAFSKNSFMNDEAKEIEVTKLPDPPRDLVKGERIYYNGKSHLPDEYLGKRWVWWDHCSEPTRLSLATTTEHYTVITTSE